MSRILLVHPPALATFQISAPLGLGYVGAALKKSGHEIKILDLDLHHAQPGAVLPILQEFRPDWVGISALTSQYSAARDVAGWVKDYSVLQSRDIKVVLGGIHASSIPEFVLKDCSSIDYVIKGEGEVAFPRLLEGQVDQPGVYYRLDGTIRVNPPEWIQDIDSLPSPWTVLNIKDYSTGRTHGLIVRRTPVSSVVSSRGCPYGCIFCSSHQTQGKKIRLRSSENFLDELEFLNKEHGVQQFNILDDNFTFYPDHVKAVCEGILSRYLDIVWSLPNGIRADKVDKSLLSLMKKAGCFYVAFGIESGSPRVLRDAHKSLDLEAVVRASKWSEEVGLVSQGFFLVGFPAETREDLEMTYKLAMSLPLDRISVNPIIPLPGSTVYEKVVSDGKLDPSTIDWSTFNRFDFFPYTGISREELAKFVKRINFRFYVRLKQILKILSRVRTWSEVEGIFLGFRILFREAGRTFAPGSRLSKKVEKRGY